MYTAKLDPDVEKPMENDTWYDIFPSVSTVIPPCSIPRHFVIVAVVVGQRIADLVVGYGVAVKGYERGAPIGCLIGVMPHFFKKILH